MHVQRSFSEMTIGQAEPGKMVTPQSSTTKRSLQIIKDKRATVMRANQMDVRVMLK
jgi:hypothetical protein